MERSPIDEPAAIYDLIRGVYNLVMPDGPSSAALSLYYIDSEHVEAEVEYPLLGVNRRAWNEIWTPERKLEVLLHEFAHIEEGPGERDHGPLFYHRLSELTWLAEDHQSELEELFGVPLDFSEVRDHVVDSVNEYTVEPEVESVEGRQNALREQLSVDSEE